ncbi:MAG: tetraacyldisaccharide 4'-kinase [Propionivibrio sp.]
MGLFDLAQRLPRLWYRPRLALPLYPLLPISWVFCALVRLRRTLYGLGVIRSACLPVPVVVVGNLTVGGSGKTPLVLWLVEELRAQGWQPGIISRGYGGSDAGVRAVATDSESSVVGDEPLLLARRSRVPVVVGRDRVAAGRALLAAHPECNVVVSDDGLQHYRLRRAVELVVFDGRGGGNQRMLPAGPLREPMRRLNSATGIVWNCIAQPSTLRAAMPPQFRMTLSGQHFSNLKNPTRRCSAADLRGRRLHAVAGIGDPARFFAQLAGLGLEVEAHPFPDHHRYRSEDLAFARGGVLLMTEKDAVKCAAMDLGEVWVLPIAATIEAAQDGRTLLGTILEKIDGRAPA